MADYVHTLKPDWLSRFIASRLDASVVVWFLLFNNESNRRHCAALIVKCFRPKAPKL